MTEQPTLYKFAYYYTSGDGSNDNGPYATYDEALKEFKEFVQSEILDDFTEEDDIVDYAKLWSCKEDEDGEELEFENLLYWTFELGYTDYDPPTKEVLAETKRLMG